MVAHTLHTCATSGSSRRRLAEEWIPGPGPQNCQRHQRDEHEQHDRANSELPALQLLTQGMNWGQRNVWGRGQGGHGRGSGRGSRLRRWGNGPRRLRVGNRHNRRGGDRRGRDRYWLDRRGHGRREPGRRDRTGLLHHWRYRRGRRWFGSWFGSWLWRGSRGRFWLRFRHRFGRRLRQWFRGRFWLDDRGGGLVGFTRLGDRRGRWLWSRVRRWLRDNRGRRGFRRWRWLGVAGRLLRDERRRYWRDDRRHLWRGASEWRAGVQRRGLTNGQHHQ